MNLRQKQHELARKIPRRNGSVLVVILVCLAAVTTILMGTITVGIRHRQHVRTEIQMEQTHWLLDAGIGKAIQAVSSDTDFENMEIKLAAPIHKSLGLVSISRLDQSETHARIRVTARLKSAHANGKTTQRSREIVVPLQPKDIQPPPTNTNNGT